MRLRKLLKKVARVEVLHLGPGDVLHVHVGVELNAAETDEVRRSVVRAGIERCLITSGDVRLSVIHDEAAA